ncbi:sensor domain-containing diguanylate cyclase [Baaleninema sp.]|uniref:sensor domain-containing diguanylate cyclase n=1 Tax=Baaleninema sp. TaxID=3101197 RepID=UPI003CFC2EA7
MEAIKTDRHLTVCRSIVSTPRGHESNSSRSSFSKTQTIASGDSPLEDLPVGIAITNAVGQILHANAAVARLFDRPLEELLHNSIDSIGRTVLRPDGQPLPRRELPTAIALRENRPVADGAMGFFSDRGTLRWLAVTATPRPPSQGGGLTVTYTEIPPDFAPAVEIVEETSPDGEAATSPNPDENESNLSETRLERILDCFLGFSSHPQENIRRLLELVREQLEAICACYQSLKRDDSLSCTSSGAICPQNTSLCSGAEEGRGSSHLLSPDGGADKPQMRIAICQPSEPLRKPFSSEENAAPTPSVLGYLCVKYHPRRQPHPEDARFLHTVATAIAVEEERLRVAETLRQQTERELVVARLASRIQQSIELPEILESATESLRRFLDADRAIVCRFNSDGSGEILGESRREGISSMLGWKTNRPWIIDGRSHQLYVSGRVMAIDDIYRADLEPEAVQLLEFFDIRARLVMPIVIDSGEEGETDPSQPSSNVWGLLVAHQCREARSWHPSEVRVLPQLATQLAIAIQQAQLYSRLKTANRELSQLATRDGLTQVANRRYFDEYLEGEWRRLTREKSPLSLILLDIDFFKDYNDGYGHQAGDDCLKQVARALETTTRRPADVVARYGGEEFAIVLPNTDEAGAVCVAGLVRSTLRNLQLVHARSPVNPYVTVSMGVASLVPFPEAEPDLLVAAADRALYRAKQNGRDRYCIAKSRDF